MVPSLTVLTSSRVAATLQLVREPGTDAAARWSISSVSVRRRHTDGGRAALLPERPVPGSPTNRLRLGLRHLSPDSPPADWGEDVIEAVAADSGRAWHSEGGSPVLRIERHSYAGELVIAHLCRSTEPTGQLWVLLARLLPLITNPHK
jgi:hypothetical protein